MLFAPYPKAIKLSYKKKPSEQSKWLRGWIRVLRGKKGSFPTHECPDGEKLATILMKASIEWLKSEQPAYFLTQTALEVVCNIELQSSTPLDLLIRAWAQIDYSSNPSHGFERLASAWKNPEGDASLTVLWLMYAYEETEGLERQVHLRKRLFSVLKEESVSEERTIEVVSFLFRVYQNIEDEEEQLVVANQLLHLLTKIETDPILKNRLLARLLNNHGSRLGFASEVVFLAEEVIKRGLCDLYLPLLAQVHSL